MLTDENEVISSFHLQKNHPGNRREKEQKIRNITAAISTPKLIEISKFYFQLSSYKSLATKQRISQIGYPIMRRSS